MQAMAKTRTVRVTGAQKSAAKALMARSAKTGRAVSPAVPKIANAKTTRSVSTSRYVTNGVSERDVETPISRT